MSKSKKVFRSILIVIVMWTLSRVVPGFVNVLFPDRIILRLLTLAVMLPVGWKAACSISKGYISGCIRVNLFLFAWLEFTGIFQGASNILRFVSYYSDGYSYDPYTSSLLDSSYLFIIGGMILFEIVYIIFCFILGNKTPNLSDVTPASISQNQPNTKEQENVQENRKKDSGYAGLIFVFIVVLFFIAAIALQPLLKQQPKLQEPTTSTTPKELTIPQVPTAITIPKVEETEGKALIKRPIPKNGAILRIPMESRVAPLSITTEGTGYYYFVLEIPETEKVYMSFFGHAGETINLKVPLGAYKLYYASGTTWYGKNDMFGENSVLIRCDDILTFSEDQNGYSGWDITLYPVAGGNMDSSYVSEDEFPKP